MSICLSTVLSKQEPFCFLFFFLVASQEKVRTQIEIPFGWMLLHEQISNKGANFIGQMPHFWEGFWPMGMRFSVPMGPQLSKQAAPFFSHFLPTWWVSGPQGKSAHYRDKHLTRLHQSLEEREDFGDIREGNSHMVIWYSAANGTTCWWRLMFQGIMGIDGHTSEPFQRAPGTLATWIQLLPEPHWDPLEMLFRVSFSDSVQGIPRPTS